MPNYQKLDPTNDILINPYEPQVDNQPGATTTVYKDPYFEQEVEGTATLEKKIASTQQRELWLVTLASGLKVRRWIKKAVAA